MATATDAEAVVQLLRSQGYEAYWVGGCVRDLLLGREPKDYDVVTSAIPDDVARIFIDHHPVGEAYGVMLVNTLSGPVEVATFRQEQAYSDRRRPDTVVWTNAKGDVLRRDFTINGLLYDPTTQQVLDYVEGQQDLKLGLIRCIGDPVARFSEDPLRMLRAVRLKNALGFQYDQATYRALSSTVHGISHVSMERIGSELNRCLADRSRLHAVQDLDRLGLLAIIIPEINETKGTPQPAEFHGEGDVFDHLLRSLGTLSNDAPGFLAWAALLHDIAKPQTLRYPPPGTLGRITTYGHAKQSAAVASSILTRLRLPRTEIETISWLIEHHMSLAHIDRLRPNKREQFVLDPRFPWLLELHHADAAGAIPVDLSLYNENLKLYKRMKTEHETAILNVFAPLINGHDLIAELGISEGPKIPQILDKVRDAQLQGKIKTRIEALEFVRSYLLSS
jgi:poly(A) polymerase